MGEAAIDEDFFKVFELTDLLPQILVLIYCNDWDGEMVKGIVLCSRRSINRAGNGLRALTAAALAAVSLQQL